MDRDPAPRADGPRDGVTAGAGGGPRGAGDPPAAGGDGLSVDLGLRLGALELEVAIDAAPGEVVAVLGPNGAGKTTLLRAIAGLLPIERGRIAIGGRVVEDAAAGVRVTPQQRSVGVVFQQHLLFGHLSALENVAFGLRARGVPRREARGRARDWLGRVGLGGEVQTKPGALSGGQAQRVALARALATDPALLLLDEPLAALDVDTRRAVRQQLRRHLDDFAGPVLLITHEPLEAINLADRLVILEQGHVVQDAPPAVVARRPRSAWAARLVGLNHYRGRADGHELTLASGATLAVADAADRPGDVLVAIHPRAVALFPSQPEGTPRNTWRATIDALDIHDDQVRVHLDGPIPIVAQITASALAELALTEGSTLWVAVKATEIEHWPV
ncbi:MAG: ABC transporter ATP-binding protein [Nitriliruptoraceae bacterium]|nr:ABC transporter ATP-binding protein [Nitriliruptoraceae bacterium]